MSSLCDISVQYIKGVGPVRKKLFSQLGIETVEDLLYFFPRRYEDRRHLVSISQLKIGEWNTVTGKVLATGGRHSWYTKKRVYEIVVADEKGRLTCVWFNQPYLEHYFKIGLNVVLHGKGEVYKNRLQMVAPEYEIIDEPQDKDHLSMGRIVPIYSLTKGMTQRYLRKIIKNCLDRYCNQLADLLPVPLRNKYRLYNIRRSINSLHFPQAFEEQEEAIRRISFEEFFFFQISVILRRMSIVTRDGIAHRIDEELMEQFIHAFPFTLTTAQKKVIREIGVDMAKRAPMLRLLQGDVGSGKTLVALFGCVVAYHNGYQSALMAPTEVLAQQHFENIKELLKGFEELRIKGLKCDSNPQFLKSFNPNSVLLTSSLSKKERENVLSDIRQGNAHLIIGTHALLSEQVTFKNLSFVVIDEQHKFGVRQRALLSDKGTQKGMHPDILIMTATPIPRTLCMTLYGDLDTSLLNEMPKGRGKTTTKLYTLEETETVYGQVRQLVQAGQQAYVVYPIIEESETLDLKAAKAMFKHFETEEFKDFRLGLVHGQMKRSDVERLMTKFKNKEIDILVATTILEVGVDVPNANVMVVEHAERFGLSQLHQLRGRIGRGESDAVCFLIADPMTEDAKARLKAILSTNDGFKIAESDLLIRGPGQYFGRHQHGLNELRVANPVKQIDLLELARKEAIELVNKDPRLEQGFNTTIRQVIQQRYPQYLEMVEAG